MNFIFILGRVLLGGYFIKSGYAHLKNLKGMAGYAASRGVPQPEVATVFTGMLLLLGGIGILLGVYVQFALFCLIVFLIPVTFKMHQYWKMTDPMQKMVEEVNFYKNLALLGAVFMLFMVPLPWVLSLR